MESCGVSSKEGQKGFARRYFPKKIISIYSFLSAHGFCKEIYEVALLVRNTSSVETASDEHVLVTQRPATGLLAGLWEFPCHGPTTNQPSLSNATANQVSFLHNMFCVFMS